MLPPTGTERLWLLPSEKARATVVVCRTILVVLLAVLVAAYHQDNKEDPLAQERLHRILLEGTCLLLVAVGFLWGCQGPRWSWMYIVLGGSATPWSSHPKLYYRQTYIQEGYEEVAQAFAEALAEGRETSMQFAVYVKGELVVDLAGSLVQKTGTNPRLGYDNEAQLKFDSHHYSTVWSCSKVVESMLMAWLVDQGHLDYQAKIVEYWPEFTGGGKEHITVGQLLHHHAGLHLPPSGILTMEDMYPENLPNGNVSKAFEGCTCVFPPKWTKALAYHAMTRGWLLNEIARRVDPQQRTMGAILREEFTTPLEIDQECYLGLPPKLCDPKTNPQLRLNDPLPSYLWLLWNKLCQVLHLPTTITWDYPLAFATFVTYLMLNWKPVSELVNPKWVAAFHFKRQPEFLRGESPSSNMQSSARALATLANAMATRDPNLFQNSSKSNVFEKLAENEETRYLMPFNKVTFNDGGLAVMSCTMDPDNIKTHFPEVPGAPYALGWFGFNGSLMAYHPEGNFAVAFQPVRTPSLFHFYLFSAIIFYLWVA